MKLPKLISDRYLLSPSVIDGRISEVFKATDANHPGKVVAIKAFKFGLFNDAVIREAFEREGRILTEIQHPCSEADWNGEGSYALNPIAVFLVESFIRALPDSIQLPELAPEPDGSITLDWIPSRHRLFSVSISASDRLAYAWLDGSDKGHAVARFDGERIPQKIIEGITAIMNHGYTTVRSA